MKISQSFLGTKDDYPGFQPKTTPAQKFATLCMYVSTRFTNFKVENIQITQ